MKYYINSSGILFAFKKDGTQDHLIAEGMRVATPEEVKAIQNPTPLEVFVRARRDMALSSTDWLVSRHRDELATGVQTTLSTVQFSELLTYRNQLRELPDDPAWPNVAVPAWQH